MVSLPVGTSEKDSTNEAFPFATIAILDGVTDAPAAPPLTTFVGKEAPVEESSCSPGYPSKVQVLVPMLVNVISVAIVPAAPCEVPFAADKFAWRHRPINGTVVAKELDVEEPGLAVVLVVGANVELVLATFVAWEHAANAAGNTRAPNNGLIRIFRWYHPPYFSSNLKPIPRTVINRLGGFVSPILSRSLRTTVSTDLGSGIS